MQFKRERKIKSRINEKVKENLYTYECNRNTCNIIREVKQNLYITIVKYFCTNTSKVTCEL